MAVEKLESAKACTISLCSAARLVVDEDGTNHAIDFSHMAILAYEKAVRESGLCPSERDTWVAALIKTLSVADEPLVFISVLQATAAAMAVRCGVSREVFLNAAAATFDCKPETEQTKGN